MCGFFSSFLSPLNRSIKITSICLFSIFLFNSQINTQHKNTLIFHHRQEPKKISTANDTSINSMCHTQFYMFFECYSIYKFAICLYFYIFLQFILNSNLFFYIPSLTPIAVYSTTPLCAPISSLL